MKNSILVYFLESFSSNEIKEFDDFIRSPFFNKNESVVRLYNYLRKYHPEFPGDKISKELVYSKLFTGTKYNDGFMRKIIFQLSRLAEQYITYASYNKNPVRVKLDFLTEINNRDLPRIFNKHFPQLQKEVDENRLPDHTYFLDKYTAEVILIGHLNNARYKIDLHDKKLSYNDHVILKMEWLEKYFLSLAINTYRYLNYEGYTTESAFSDEILDLLINYLIDIQAAGKSSPVYDNNPFLNLHINEIMLMKNKDTSGSLETDSYYHKLKDTLVNGSPGFPVEHRFSLYNILHQHCAYKLLRGFEGYKNERFELDKIALNNKIYKTDFENHFPPPAFAILVRDAAESGEIEWADNFIKDHRDTLDRDNYDTVINISYGLVNFYRGNYRESLDCLNKIKPVKRWEFKLAVKELTMMLYYELSMIQEAFYLADSFRHFVSKLGAYFPEERVISRNNFLKYYLRLLKIKENRSAKGIDEINMDLENKKLVIFNRFWLGEKLKELENQ